MTPAALASLPSRRQTDSMSYSTWQEPAQNSRTPEQQGMVQRRTRLAVDLLASASRKKYGTGISEQELRMPEPRLRRWLSRFPVACCLFPISHSLPNPVPTSLGQWFIGLLRERGFAGNWQSLARDPGRRGAFGSAKQSRKLTD
jgi:hypothetical protein